MTKEEAYKLLKNGEFAPETVNFHRTVPGHGGTPEYAFYKEHPKSSRQSNMLLTPHGLICESHGAITIVPLANLVYAK